VTAVIARNPSANSFMVEFSPTNYLPKSAKQKLRRRRYAVRIRSGVKQFILRAVFFRRRRQVATHRAHPLRTRGRCPGVLRTWGMLPGIDAIDLKLSFNQIDKAS